MNPEGWPTDKPDAPRCEDCGSTVTLAWLHHPNGSDCFSDHGPRCLKCAGVSA